MKPFNRIILLSQIYNQHIGSRRMFLLFVLQTTVAFAEGLGITLLLPLLTSLKINSAPDTGATKIVYDALAQVGAEKSMIMILLIIGLVFFGKGILLFAEKLYQGYLQSKLMQELKSKVFDAANSMDYRYYTKRNSGHFVNIMNDQITRFYLSFKGYVSFFTSSIMAIGYLLFGIFISWEFVLLAIISSIIILLAFRVLNKFMRLISRKTASETSNLNKFLVQSIHAFKYIVSTNQGEEIGYEVKRSISKLTKYLFQENAASAVTVSIREPLSVIFIISIVIMQMVYLGREIGPIIVAILLFYRAIGCVLLIQSSWLGVMSMTGSVEMVSNEFKLLEQNKEVGGTMKLRELSQAIELWNVSFKYDQTPVLENINIRIPANKTIAIIGESGAGKSTLIDLLTLLLKPQFGYVLIDGVKALDVELSSWRMQIGYVSQESVVFDDTVANNISMWKGRPDTDINLMERIKDAAKQANILDFLEGLPEGFNTPVGDRGIRLSGGQKQRLCIARELFKKPKLLILDEATSALDTESEKHIKDSIDALKGSMTVVQIAHRISSIQNADYVYILNKGKVIEEGTYQELSNILGSRLEKMVAQQRI